MGFSIGEIARELGATALGDTDLVIERAAEPAMAGPDDLALAMSEKFAGDLAKGAARAAILWDGADWQGLGLEAAIVPDRPRYAMAGLTAMLDPGPGFGGGIHDSAVIDPTAEIGAGVSVGPFAVISAGARIGDGAVIGPQCFIGQDAVLGAGALLHPGVRIAARAQIGARLIAHFGANIGQDGFSFATADVNAVEKARASLGEESEAQAQSWVRIHSLGSVVIGDDVEIGANTCIDAGTIRPTRIGNRSKLDNLCHIAHNVVVGDDCLFAGQIGIAGSTVIGNNVVFGGQVGVSDNITVGDGVVAGGASSILSNVPAGRAVLGYPAVKMDSHIESYKAIRRLPRMARELAALKDEIKALKGKA